MNVPKGLSEVTADWLESVLQPSEEFNGVEIESVSCENIGEGTGIFGEIGLLTISWASDGDFPASMVVKLPCIEPENLAVARHLVFMLGKFLFMKVSASHRLYVFQSVSILS